MPSSEDTLATIRQIEAALEPANSELDRLYAGFGKELPAEVEAWMKRQVERRIELNAAKVNAEGVQPLRRLKADLTSLIARLPQVCEAAIGAPDQWPHRRMPTSRSQCESRSGESHSAACFRKAIDNLGALLGKHGLIVPERGTHGEWEQAGVGQYRYAINPGFDARRFPALVEYQEKRTAQARLLEQLDAKRAELASILARELWDKA